MQVTKEEIEAVKAANDLAAVVAERGIAVTRKGRQLVASCPFHQERTASFTVSPARGLFYYFGSGAAGDVTGFVTKHDRSYSPGALAGKEEMRVNVIAQEQAAVSQAPSRRREAAEVRIEAALACLEQGRRLIDEAARALCSVKGMAGEWRRLGALEERVRRLWYGVQGKADSLSLQGRLLLDHEPDHRQEHWRALRRGR